MYVCMYLDSGCCEDLELVQWRRSRLWLGLRRESAGHGHCTSPRDDRRRTAPPPTPQFYRRRTTGCTASPEGRRRPWATQRRRGVTQGRRVATQGRRGAPWRSGRRRRAAERAPADRRGSCRPAESWGTTPPPATGSLHRTSVRADACSNAKSRKKSRFRISKQNAKT